MPRRATAQQRFRGSTPRPRPAHGTTVVRNRSGLSATVYSATVTNSGTLATSPTISKTGVTGPVTVYFENVTAGKTVWVNVPSGTGDLSVDFATKTVTHAGSTVSGAVTEDSRWWTLAPGANTVRSNIAASVTHRDAYTG